MDREKPQHRLEREQCFPEKERQMASVNDGRAHQDVTTN